VSEGSRQRFLRSLTVVQQIGIIEETLTREVRERRRLLALRYGKAQLRISACCSVLSDTKVHSITVSMQKKL
jgi:hypothetical protein